MTSVPTIASKAGRYVMVAGLAAAEVGALMTLQTILAVAVGVLGGGPALGWTPVPDILLFVALGTWFWWRRSLSAAGLMLALVAGEYCYLAVTSGRSNTWLTTYLCLFLIGISVHGWKAKETSS
jgi:hypothetical protein